MSKGKFGTVDKLPSGRYRARYRHAGKLRSAPTTFEDEQTARDWLDELTDQMKRTEWSPDKGGGESFESWANRYVELPRKRRKRTDTTTTSKKSSRTKSDYESIFKNHVIPLIGDLPIERMDLQRAVAFQSDIEEKCEGKYRTIEKVMNYTSWVMNFAVRKGAIRINPFLDEEIVMPDGSFRREPVPLDPADIERLANCINPHFKLVPILVAYTGLRAGELWALKRRSVNPLKKELIVSHSVGEIKGEGLVMGPPKGGRSRNIALPGFLFDLVMEHMEATGGKVDDWLFRTEFQGKQVRHTNFMQDTFRPAKLKAELPVRTRFHDLRHYCAHYHISAGFEAGDIKELMGHKSITVTMDIYGGLFDSRRREMADKVHRMYEASRPEGVSRVSDVDKIRSIETG